MLPNHNKEPQMKPQRTTSGTRSDADLVPYARAHADERAQNIDGEQLQIGCLGLGF